MVQPKPPHQHLAWMAGCVSICLGGLASAQPIDHTPAEPDPARETAPPARPASRQPATVPGAIPGLEGADFLLRPPALRREGTFIVRQRGSMVTLRTGEKAVVFHADDQGRAERPMLLVPNKHLSRLEELAMARDTSTAFWFTGQVFVYRRTNYLLLTVPPTLAAPSTAASTTPEPAPAAESEEGNTSESQGGSTPSEPRPAASLAVGPDGTERSVEDIMAELERRREGQRTLVREDDHTQPVPGAPAPNAASTIPPVVPSAGTPQGGASEISPEMLPEGKFLSRRDGRLVRTSAGDWAIALDSDGDSPAPPPMLLTPCVALERLEATVSAMAQAPRVQVSGRVLLYGGRNYLIPSLVRIAGASDVKPRQ